MNEVPVSPQPPWANPAAWLFSLAVVALLALGVAQGEQWSERNVLRYAAALLGVFGIGFFLSSYSPNGPAIFRFLVWLARRGRRWFGLSGLITGGKPRAAGWLCLGLAAAVFLVSVFMPGTPKAGETPALHEERETIRASDETYPRVPV